MLDGDVSGNDGIAMFRIISRTDGHGQLVTRQGESAKGVVVWTAQSTFTIDFQDPHTGLQSTVACCSSIRQNLMKTSSDHFQNTASSNQSRFSTYWLILTVVLFFEILAGSVLMVWHYLSFNLCYIELLVFHGKSREARASQQSSLKGHGGQRSGLENQATHKN